MTNYTPQQTNTILAALRYYQQQGLGDPRMRPQAIHRIATDHDETSLDEKGIDELCEAINLDNDQPTPCEHDYIQTDNEAPYGSAKCRFCGEPEPTDGELPRQVGRSFVTTYLNREDVDSRGFDSSKISDDDMQDLARKVVDMETYWIAIDCYCEYNNVPRLKGKKP